MLNGVLKVGTGRLRCDEMPPSPKFSEAYREGTGTGERESVEGGPCMSIIKFTY